MNIIERFFRGATAVRAQRAIEEETATLQAGLRDHRVQFRGEVNQHRQVVEANSRILETMRNMLIMVDGRGLDK